MFSNIGHKLKVFDSLLGVGVSALLPDGRLWRFRRLGRPAVERPEETNKLERFFPGKPYHLAYSHKLFNIFRKALLLISKNI
jgi:hypothetical protein